MTPRAHRSLRLGALALLCVSAAWPRTGEERAGVANNRRAARAQLETAAARPAAPAASGKLVSNPADEPVAVISAN